MRAVVARVDEPRCIGCTRCIDACPVDAIVGAQGLMHTVVESWCIGCELCLPPCPVDCIDLVAPRDPWTAALRRAAGARGKSRLKRLKQEEIHSTSKDRKSILVAALARKAR